MALFGTLGSFLSNTLSTIGGALGGNLGSAINLGSSLVSSQLPAQGPAPPPVIIQQAAPPPQQVAMSTAPRVSGTMNLGPPIVAAGMAVRKGLTAVAAQALIKIAQVTGRRTMSLRSAVKIIRKLGRTLGPAGVAAALGITAAELAELIVADSSRTRRRMNPANIHALRRSMRRISSFHRLAQKADMMRGRSGSRRRTKPCPPGGTQIVRAG